jgi:outer membrane protein assembly factor BamB
VTSTGVVVALVVATILAPRAGATETPGGDPETEVTTPAGPPDTAPVEPPTTLPPEAESPSVVTPADAPVTPLASNPNGVQIQAVDWRPGVVNTQTAELYAMVDTGGVLVVGMGNVGNSPLTITGAQLDGTSIAGLRDDRQLMWWRPAPASIAPGGVGSVMFKLMSPYGAGRDIDITIETSQGPVSLSTTIDDAPVRLSSVTLDAAGVNLLIWLRNDGDTSAALPASIALSGQVVAVAPSQTVIGTGEVAYYQLPAPPGGPRARYVSVGVEPVVNGTARPAYAHLKVAPAFSAHGGYGDARNFPEEQADLGLNLVTRGLFSSPAQQDEFTNTFCIPFGIRVWLADASSAPDSTLATQGSSPCVAGFGKDEPDFSTYPANDGDAALWDAMQELADQQARQSNATNNELMDHITNAIGRAISSFSMLADVAGNDHYATDSVSSDGDSSHPLEEAGYFTQLTRRAAEPRPSYDWAQWSADQSWSTGEAWNRQPSVEELRLQAYTMLQEGVKSLLWFTFNKGRVDLFPDLAREVARVNREQGLIRNMVTEGTEAPGLARVTNQDTDVVRARVLAGTDGLAVLVTNLDYTYTRVVRSKPVAPSPTPFAEFTPKSGVEVAVRIPAWINPATATAVLVDPATGPLPLASTLAGGDLVVTVPDFTTTAMIVVLPDEEALPGLETRWDDLSVQIPGASAPDAPPGPVPPDNAPWNDGLPDLVEDWEVATRDVVMGAPVVVGERVYAVSRDGAVRSLALADGSQAWVTPLPGKVYGGLVVSDGRVYVVNTDGTIFVLDADDGSEITRASIGTEVMSTPVVASGRLVVAGIDGLVRGLDASTLAEVWSISTTAGPVVADLAVADLAGTPVVIVGSTNGLVYAVSASNGGYAWGTDLGDQIVAAPAVVDGLVVAGSTGGRLVALTTAGDEVWSVDLPAPLLRKPGIGNGQVVVGTPAYNGCFGADAGPATFRAFDADTGEAQWDAGFLGCDFGHSAPTFGDGSWFAGTSWGSLVRMDPSSGAPNASIVTDGWVLATPVIANGKVVMGSDDQRIRLLDGGGPDPVPTTTPTPPTTEGPVDPNDGGQLPSTGASVAPFILASMVLVAAGVALAILANRRRSLPAQRDIP